MDYLKLIEDELSSGWAGEIPGAAVKVQKGTIDSFTITIRNRTGLAKKIALLPAYFPTGRPAIPAVTTQLVKLPGGGTLSAGTDDPFMLYDDVSAIAVTEPVDAVIGAGLNGVIYANSSNPSTANIEVSSEEFSIADFLNFVRNVPSAVKDIVVNVNDQSVLYSTLKVKKVTPFNSEASFNIKLTDFLNTSQNIDKKVVVNTIEKYGRVLQLDAQTLVVYNMPGTVNGTADVTVSFQFNLNRMYNIADLNMVAAINENLASK